eukprot:gene8453-4282_t
MVVDAFGGWAPDAAAAVRDIARAQAARRGTDPALTLEHAHQSLSVTLWRGNVCAALARLETPASHDTATAALFGALRRAETCAAAGVGAPDADAAAMAPDPQHIVAGAADATAGAGPAPPPPPPPSAGAQPPRLGAAGAAG